LSCQLFTSLLSIFHDLLAFEVMVTGQFCVSIAK